MKKTQIIELINTIKKTLVSFVSITMFVLFGVAIYLSFSWTAKSLKYELSNRYNDNNYHDLAIYYPYGINKEDLDQFKQIEDVDEVEGQFYAFEFFKSGENTHQAKIMSITSNIDVWFDLEGRLPQNSKEILLDKGSSETRGLNIGDKITFFGEDAKRDYLITKITNDEEVEIDELVDINSREFNYLIDNEVTIVGLVQNPEYVNKGRSSYGYSANSNIEVDAIFYTYYDYFDPTIVSGYNNVLIRSNKLKNLYTCGDEYLDLAEELKEKVTDVANEISERSYLRVKNSSKDFVDDSKEKLDDAHNQLIDAQNEINDALKEIFSKFKELGQNEKDLEEFKRLLDEAEVELDEGYKKICAAEKELQENKDSYNKTKNTVEGFITAYNYLKLATYRLDEFFNETSIEDIEGYIDDMETLLSPESLELLIYFINNDYIEIDPDGEIAAEIKSLTDPLIKAVVDVVFDWMKDYKNTKEGLTEEQKSFLEEMLGEYDQIILTAASNEELAKKMYREVLEEMLTVDLSNLEFNEDETELILYLYDLFYIDFVADIEAAREDIGPVYEKTKAITIVFKDVFDSIGDNDQVVFDIIREKLAEIKQQLDEAEQQLNDAKKLYYSSLSEFNEKKAEYEDYVQQLKDGKIKLNNAQEDVAEYQDELNKSYDEYENGVDSYNQLVETTDRIQDYGVNISTRSSSIGYIYLLLLTDIIDNLKKGLGGLFLIISLFVCYSVITRNVVNQIKQIGTKKALGLNQKEITLSFILYSTITVIVGGILGVLLAYFVIERVLVPKVGSGYTYICTNYYFSFKDASLLILAEFVLIEIITLIGCLGLLKKNAVILLQGPEPPNGKQRFYEKWSIWNKTSLLTKTIINNFINDKRRVFATLIGIVGCTALVVSSIMLRNNVLDSFDKQYDDYFAFDTMVYYDTENEKAANNVRLVLEKNNVKYANIFSGIGYVHSDNFENVMIKEFVYDDIDTFKDVVKFKIVEGNDFYYDGAWLSESIKVYYDLDENETVTLIDSIGTEGDVKLDGFYKYYFYNPILFMDSETYSKSFNTDKPRENMFIIDTENIDINDLVNQLKNVEGFINTFNYYESCLGDVEIFEVIANVLVGLYTLVSVLMSVFVLLNLFDTFVMEKKSELIILMINGFTTKDAKRYIYFDTIVLTIVGVILGVVAGSFVGVYAIGAFESERMYMLHKANLIACCLGALSTIILTYIMTKISLKKIDKFELTDINKD